MSLSSDSLQPACNPLQSYFDLKGKKRDTNVYLLHIYRYLAYKTEQQTAPVKPTHQCQAQILQHHPHL